MSDSNGDLESSLWESAKKLRGPVDPSEYKDYSLGLLFLKSMSESFEKRRKELREKTHDSDSGYYTEDDEEREYILNDKDEYTKKNVFYIPEEARWEDLVERATDPQIGKKIDDAMRAIEEENPRLKNMLPKQYSRSTLPHDSLENLINLYNNVDLNNGNKDEDVFGRIYEYFIKQFAMQGGQKGGEFYTPKSVVELMVEILEPYEGRIFDPFGGSGGMFVQSQKFIESHGGDTDKISIYGQEINEDTWRICQMNLYLRGLDGNIKLGDSITDDQHKGLKADYVITNPPFNMEDWGRNSVAEDDPRFRYGVPPASKQGGNYAFIQHMLSHTNKTGMIATVMANGAMSVQGDEGEIRKKMIEDDLLDAVIAMPQDLFYTTGVSACIFVFAKDKSEDEYRDRSGETLFIDAREMYESVSRSQNKFAPEHIEKISNTVRAYRGKDVGKYEDEVGFCKVASIEEISENHYTVTPGRYVGIKQDEEDEPFEKRIEELAADVRENFERSKELQEKVKDNLGLWLTRFNQRESEMVYDEDFDKEIPKSWEKKSLEEIASFMNGKAWQNFESNDKSNDKSNDLPVIKVKELRKGITEDSDRVNRTECPDEYIISEGTLLFSWSASLVLKVWNDEEAFLNQHLFKVSSDNYPKWFVYAWIDYHIHRFRNIAEAKKTTMGHIKRSDLKESKVLIPPQNELESMSEKIEPIFDLIIQTKSNNEFVTDLRDTLLPKLLSGEIGLEADEDE